MTIYLTPDSKGDYLATRQAGGDERMAKHIFMCHSYHIHRAS